MNTFKGEGTRLDYTNSTSSAISSGDVVVIGDMIAIAVADIAVDAVGAVEVAKEHVLTAETSDSWDQGDQLYWDATNEYLTSTSGGNTAAGRASAAKAVSATTAQVLLNNNS